MHIFSAKTVAATYVALKDTGPGAMERRLDKQMLPGLGWKQATASRQVRSPKLEVLGGVAATTGPKVKMVTRVTILNNH